MTQFNLPDGLYKARIRQCFISSTTDNQKYVQVDFEIHTRDCIHNLYWRSPLTRGASKKTFNSLKKLGAKMEVYDYETEDHNHEPRVLDILDGVGSINPVEILTVTLECDENEAKGKFRTFVEIPI